MSQFTRMTVAAAVLIAGFALAAPAFAADGAPPTAKKHHAGLEARSMAGVEGRIAELHTRFGITPAQEPQWVPFAQVMRDNTKTYDELAKNRAEKMQAMNAVEDLRSFGEIAQTHADGLKKLTASFQAVYDGMSPEQRKNADSVFHAYAQGGPGHHAKKPAKPS